MTTKRLSVMALSLTLLGGGVLFAQGQSKDAADKGKAAPSNASKASSRASVEGQIPVPNNPDAMRRNAASMRNEIASFAKQTMVLRRQAEGAKDVIKLDCVNSQLLALKSRARAADEAAFDLQALGGGATADARASHAYKKLYLSHQGAESAFSTAEQCIGDELSLVGQTRTEKTAGPDVVTDPTDVNPFDASGFNPVIPEGPPNQSAF